MPLYIIWLHRKGTYIGKYYVYTHTILVCLCTQNYPNSGSYANAVLPFRDKREVGGEVSHAFTSSSHIPLHACVKTCFELCREQGLGFNPMSGHSVNWSEFITLVAEVVQVRWVENSGHLECEYVCQITYANLAFSQWCSLTSGFTF